MTQARRRAMDGVESIVFDRRKYGTELLVDACEIGAIPGFIKTPRPHRLGFYEVALISEGSGVLDLDDAAADVAPRKILLTAPGEVRRWRLARPGLEGLLVFFEAELAESLMGAAGADAGLAVLDVAARERSFATSRRAFDKLLDLAGGMRDELGRLRADSGHALRADTYRLLVDLQRAAAPASGAAAGPSGAPAASVRARALAARFDALIEERFRVDQRLASYAERLGVGTRHLGGVVRQVTGQSPAERIRRRQFVEARRLLLDSPLSIGAIAESLNFADASYFTRFFRRHAGVTPLHFRDRSGTSRFPSV